MWKLLKIIILIGIFTLPLINSRITELLWFSFSIPVNWNFEFTKVMFFNVWSGVVIGLYLVQSLLTKESRSALPTAVIFFYLILVFSTHLSTSPYISFFWNEIKSHSFIMWSNLVWLFIVFQLILNKAFFKQIIITFIVSWIFVSIIWFKEYFFPTFNYWDLWNRLFSTFGHPNYVSIFLVSLIPFLYNPLSNFPPKGERIAQLSIILLFLAALLFTKSVFAIFLFVCFNLWYFNNISPFFKGSTLKWNARGRASFIKYSVALLTIAWSSFLLFNFFPEKLHSFISRYFIWETSFKTIFSDIKIFLIWWWTETLVFYFDNFKSQYLYIFENLGFSADRPHNIILNFFYHFWVWWLAIILWIYFKVFSYKNTEWIHKFTPTRVSLILMLLFLLLNPTSIVLYLFIVILLANVLVFPLVKNKDQGKRYYWSNIILFTVITIISIYWAYYSIKYYYSENKTYNKQLLQAKNIYKYNPNSYFYSWDFVKWLEISRIPTTEYYYTKIKYTEEINEKIKICNNYITKYNYAETYFFCGNELWYLEKNKAKQYYKQWLNLLPDLWNKNSKYYSKFLVKYLNINWNRFLSKKYWLAQILERVWIINE